MKMIISNSSSIPIYEQIKKCIQEQILSGELLEDEALPSIRQLATEIKISVMTIKKAYDELEKEGYLISRQGKGTFVAPKNTELALEHVKQEIEQYIQKIIALSTQYQITKEEVIEVINLFYGSDGK